MKLTKKVLSILLAIAMVLGTFAVAASANGNPDTATHRIKIWLTTSPVTSGAEWTSASDWTKPVWTPSDTGDMEVTAGQKIMLAIHVETNYYVGHCASIVFFDDRLLDPNEIRMSQGYEKSDVAIMRTMTDYNANNSFVPNVNLDKPASSCNSVYTPKNYMNALNRCIDDDGN